MKNFIQPGEVVTLTAPYDVESGDGLLVGSLFGVANGKALNGAEVEAALCGVYSLKKDVSVPAMGGKAYWDNAAKKITSTVGTNTHVGFYVKAALTGDAEVAVKLLF